jgi:diaminopimelate decarboxylase
MRKGYYTKTFREVEDTVANLASLWWPTCVSGDFIAEDRHLTKTNNRYLRYCFV